MNPQFNLLDEPWLPVRLSDGAVRAFGLLDVVRRSSDIVALAETAPPSLIAEYRLLLAITHRALVRSFGTWRDSQRAVWYRDGLPVQAICDYLEAWRHRFWLFHDDWPFLQVAALATAQETRDKRKPWTQVSLSSANGNTPVVFDHSVDTTPMPISRAAAVAHLLGFLQFTPGGLVKTLRDADKAGPLANTAAVLPTGVSLAKTLCLALHPSPLAGQPEADLPAWERATLTLKDLSGAPVLATGPNDRYTRQSRAVLLESGEQDQISWLRFAAGWALEENPQQPDPMASYRPGSMGLVRVSFTEGRAAWRDLPALVPVPHEEGQPRYQAAPVLNWAAGLHRLMGQSSALQPLLVAGLASDQAKLLRWRLEQFALPRELLIEPDRARELHACMALAEEIHRQQRRLASDLVAATFPDPTSKDTGGRAREAVERSPWSSTFFGAVERALAGLMELLAQDRSQAAELLWHQTLRHASQLAWLQLVQTLGSSPRALRAEALHAPRLGRLLHRYLPAAEAPSSAASH